MTQILKSPSNVGELHLLLFPFYALTNWIGTYRAYHTDAHTFLRISMVLGLFGGAVGHGDDLV